MSNFLPFLFCLLLLSPAVRSQNFSSNVRINDDTGTRAQKVPAIQVDRDGKLYVMWTDYRSNSRGDIAMATSTDGGRTFSANRSVYSGGGVPGGNQRRTNFVIDGKEWLHAVWVEMKTNNQPDVFYSRSENGGMTFTEPVSLSDDSARYAQDFPSIAVDENDNLYVAFVDARDQQSGAYTNHLVYFTKSTDGGQTFSTPIPASVMPDGGGCCECCALDIVASPLGDVYIAFRTNIRNRRDVFVSRSFDGGESFETAIPAASQTWTIDACPMTGPSIALDRYENLHLAWRDSRQASGGRDIVYYTVLHKGADACMPDMRISDSPRQTNYATIRILPSGVIIVTYQDTRNDAMDVFCTYSFDGGNTFTAGIKVTDESGTSRQEEAHLAIGSDGTRYIVWQDSRRDEADVYFTRNESPPTPVIPAAVIPISPKDDVSLESFSGFEWLPPENLSSDRNTQYDLTYEKDGAPKTITGITGRTFNLPLDEGTYRWWVHARTPTGSSQQGPIATFTIQSPTSIVIPTRPEDVVLSRVYPNPAHVGDRLLFEVSANFDTHVALSIHTLLGTRVRTVHEGRLPSGTNVFQFRTDDIPRGVYLLRLLGKDLDTTRLFIVH